MHLATAAAASITLLATLASTVMSDPWKNLGADLAYVGPSYNATFKAGDTIPLEYTFCKFKMVSTSTTAAPAPTGTTSTPPPAAPSTGTMTLTSLAWVGQTGNQTVAVALDNDRTNGFSSPCLATDLCEGTHHPKRINLVIPAETYPGNYTIVLGLTLSLAGNRTLLYKEPITVVAATANVTTPQPVFPNAPAVQATLPVYAPPKSSGLTLQASKAALGMTILVASAVLML
ncbi:hypothetical protein EDD11_000210 [Mortierella claussenii]|nr:hypothetical protein EDD11_000210 [Mortierella claussenii]